MQGNHSVFLVDPDEAIGDGLVTLLGTYGIDVLVYASAESLLGAGELTDLSAHGLLIEANLPGLSGLMLTRRLRDRGFTAPIIMLMNPADPDVRCQAKRFGVTEVLAKPLVDGILVKRLIELLPGSFQQSKN